MTILYCTPKVLSFIRFRRPLLAKQDNELVIRVATQKYQCHGYDPRSTFFVKGEFYERLDKNMRAFVEKKYKERLA